MFSLKLKPLLFFFISLSFIISVCGRANGMNASAAQMKAAKLQSDLSNLESDLAQAQGLSINTVKEIIKTAQGFPQKKSPLTLQDVNSLRVSYQGKMMPLDEVPAFKGEKNNPYRATIALLAAAKKKKKFSDIKFLNSMDWQHAPPRVLSALASVTDHITPGAGKQLFNNASTQNSMITTQKPQLDDSTKFQNAPRRPEVNQASSMTNGLMRGSNGL